MENISFELEKVAEMCDKISESQDGTFGLRNSGSMAQRVT